MELFGYEKLDTWQNAKRFAIKVYKITDGFPEKERFGLISQINRAAISIASNIAEGNGRRSSKDRAHFVEIAFGSLMEVACQTDISSELGYLSKTDYEDIRNEILILTRMLSKLRSSYLKNIALDKT